MANGNAVAVGAQPLGARVWVDYLGLRANLYTVAAFERGGLVTLAAVGKSARRIIRLNQHTTVYTTSAAWQTAVKAREQSAAASAVARSVAAYRGEVQRVRATRVHAA